MTDMTDETDGETDETNGTDGTLPNQTITAGIAILLLNKIVLFMIIILNIYWNIKFNNKSSFFNKNKYVY